MSKKIGFWYWLASKCKSIMTVSSMDHQDKMFLRILAEFFSGFVIVVVDATLILCNVWNVSIELAIPSILLMLHSVYLGDVEFGDLHWE